MFFVTNRKISTSKTGLDVFGDTPNPKGSNELRLLKVEKQGKNYSAKLMMDKLSTAEKRDLKKEFDLPIDTSEDWYASLMVACVLFKQASTQGKSILFFVHGYNNDVKDVFKTASEIERRYNVIVVPFTWPANGGGALSGTASYLDDKKDARASTNALDSLVMKISQYHDMLTASARKDAMTRASNAHKTNPEAAREYYIRLLDRSCKVKISLACHSMGNYLLKYSLMPSSSALAQLVFDNVVLIAADANNKDHENWVERLDTRNRVYVIINEDDSALQWSRRKPGKEQLARLGHYLKKLRASNAYYLNLTEAKYVGSEHSYFKGRPVNSNKRLEKLFTDVFQGVIAERGLVFRADVNAYELN